MGKKIGTITYIPIMDMTAEDWLWLDFENIRTVAQTRIATEIMAGRLEGFFRVNLIQKAAKNMYLWPANAAAIRDLENNDWNAFGHVSETDGGRSLDQLNVLRGLLAFLPIAVTTAILRHVEERIDTERAERISDPSLDNLPSEAVELISSTVLMWLYNYEEATALLEELPDSDEADEVRDYLNSFGA